MMAEISATDPSSGDLIKFTGMLNPNDGWAWQREMLDWWLGNNRTIVLKARQLGVTWVSAGFALWHLLFKPGSRVLIYSTGESQAQEVMKRIWLLYQSLPKQLRAHVKVIKPDKTPVPTEQIIVAHDETRLSSIRALSSTVSAGHGETAALVILDEFAYNDNAAAIWKATQPTMSHGGRTVIISTANGSAGNYEQQNFFYSLWVNAEARKLKTKFYGWQARPGRDESWYDEHVKGVYDKRQRAESYPSNPSEAFQGTGENLFDDDAMDHYRDLQKEPLYRFNFDIDRVKGGAKIKKAEEGIIRVFQEPEDSKEYVIAVDPAAGSGLDYSAVYVLDLHTQAICAEIYDSHVQPDILAEILYYLGNWYHKARIAVERAASFHAVIITSLRKGGEGRSPYPRIYKHRDSIRPDELEEKAYGFPMTQKTRPQVVSALQEAIREKSLPWVTKSLFNEMNTFGYYQNKSGTMDARKPQAAPGCHDDAVLSACIAMYLYGLYGKAEKASRSIVKKRMLRKKLAPRPWENV
jgi:hypothetical protein